LRYLAHVEAGTGCRRGLRFGARLVPGWGFLTETARNAGNLIAVAAAENKLRILNCRINVKLFQNEDWKNEIPARD
jgi:hypothetical protein